MKYISSNRTKKTFTVTVKVGNKTVVKSWEVKSEKEVKQGFYAECPKIDGCYIQLNEKITIPAKYCILAGISKFYSLSYAKEEICISPCSEEKEATGHILEEGTLRIRTAKIKAFLQVKTKVYVAVESRGIILKRAKK